MFEKRRVDSDVYKKLGIGAMKPEYTEVKKNTSLVERMKGGEKWSRDHGERRPSRGGEVKRLDDRMMKIAMVCLRKILHVFSVYAPQQGTPDEEKEEFLEKLSDNIHDVSQEDLLMVSRG